VKRILSYIRRNKYVLLSLYFVVYIIAFFVVESIEHTDYWVSYMHWDDYIPFCKYFIVPYCLWYPYLAVCGLYLLFTQDKEAFCKYMYFIMISFTATLIFSVLFPNGQDLRHTQLGDGFFDRLVLSIYTADTNTNVLPSMHVTGTMAGIFALYKAKKLKWFSVFRFVMVIVGTLIIASTVLVKQHSILDVLVSFVLCAPLYWLVFADGLKRIAGLFRKKR